jgi:signal transduction histidine kinase
MWEEMADDGPGLAGEAVQVFERVFRVDPSRTSTNRCAGLGLSIA